MYIAQGPELQKNKNIVLAHKIFHSNGERAILKSKCYIKYINGSIYKG